VQQSVTESKPLPERPKPTAPRKIQPQPPKERITRPVPAGKISTRQQQTGRPLVLRDTLQDLRQNTVATSLKQAHALSQSGGQASKTERAISCRPE
jgi:hypothetical protein